jgi:tetratricopeptide (TPR) repeat protein
MMMRVRGNSLNQVTDSEQSHQQLPLPAADQAGPLAAELSECQNILAAALEQRTDANVAALMKVASRIRTLPASFQTDAQFKILQAVCRFFLSQDKELPFAMEAAQYVIRLARSLGRKKELLNGLSVQALIASQLDNHIEAVEACANARETAIEMGSAVGELKAVINGAAVYLNVGYYDSALSLLRVALTIADRCPEEEAARAEWVVLGNIAQCHLFLGNFDEASRSAAAARAMAPEEAEGMVAHNRAILEFTTLRILFAQGRGIEARPVLASMAASVGKAATPRARIDFAVARALVEIAEGKREIGFARLAAALEKANIITSTLPDVLSAMIAAYDLAGLKEDSARMQDRLRQLLANRQETARLRADLVRDKVGVTGQGPRVSDYDRRLDAARERLLRLGDS